MKNKKVLIIALVVVVVLAVVLAVVLLGGEKEYKLGMGAVAGDHTDAQANLTIATVVLDADGKIVACRLDVAQNKYAPKQNADGTFALDFKVLESKRELLERYGMKETSAKTGIGKEWYEQAEAFEAWVVGKTGAEVAELLKYENLVPNGSHMVTKDEVLKAGCTIDVQDFRDAVVKACNDAQGVSFKAGKDFTLGLGVNSADDSSSITDMDTYTIKLNVEFAASVVVDGKVVASLNDAYQPNVVVDGKNEEGKLIVTKATVGTFNKDGVQDKGFMTKRELKDDYAMRGTSAKAGIGKEWFEQSAAYSQYVVGKTADEIKGIELNDELKAGCTIYIGGINAVVAESVTNAR